MLVLGHRGVRRSLPENTLDSLAAVFDHGADGAEFDVRLTRDGVTVLHHDPRLDRMARLPRRIADLDWPDLRSLTGAGPAPVATLAEAVARLGPAAFLDVEIKDPAAAPVAADVLAAHPEPGRVAISSFDPEVLESLRAAGCPVGLWLNAAEFSSRMVRLAADLGATALIVPLDQISPDAVRRVADAGLRLGCWGFGDVTTLDWLRTIGCRVAIPDLPLGKAAE